MLWVRLALCDSEAGDQRRWLGRYEDHVDVRRVRDSHLSEIVSSRVPARRRSCGAVPEDEFRAVGQRIPAGRSSLVGVVEELSETFLVHW
jgi:hypothetical protein